jgi:hypothetical protein
MSTQKPGSPGHTEKQAFDELYESGITVCGLLVGYDYFKTKRYDPIGSILMSGYRKKYFGPGSIRTYAKDTGGVVIDVKQGAISARLTDIIIQLRSRYSFGYISADTKMDGKFRKIRLAVSSNVEKQQGRVAVITRKGYYARRRGQLK